MSPLVVRNWCAAAGRCRDVKLSKIFLGSLVSGYDSRQKSSATKIFKATLWKKTAWLQLHCINSLIEWAIYHFIKIHVLSLLTINHQAVWRPTNMNEDRLRFDSTNITF